MKNTGLMRFSFSCAVVMTAVAIPYLWNVSVTSAKEAKEAKDIETHHSAEITPTRSLMRLISSHTSKILDAIMIGDHDAVIKESSAVAESSKAIMKNFFPEGGQVGEWFKETGKNPKIAEDVNAVKKEFEKYLKTVIDSANNVAETSKKQNIVETYKSFDAMLKNACFTCHEIARPKWPEWPEWMQITGG